LLPFFLCLIFLNRFVTREKKVFFLYTILITILVIVGFSLLYILKSPESYYKVARIYIFLEFTLLSYLFSLYIKNKSVRKLIRVLFIPFLLFGVYDYLREEVPGIPFIPASVSQITVLCIIIYFFFEIMQESVLEPVYQRAIFWVSVAFIINSSGNFFLFLYSKTSYDDDVFKRQYTIIYTTVTVLKNILLCISIPLKDKQDSQQPDTPIDIDLDSFHPIKNQTQLK